MNDVRKPILFSFSLDKTHGQKMIEVPKNKHTKKAKKVTCKWNDKLLGR